MKNGYLWGVVFTATWSVMTADPRWLAGTAAFAAAGWLHRKAGRK